MRLGRRSTPPFAVPAGERLLAWAETGDGAVGGSRDAFYVWRREAGSLVRLPWEQVEAADWDRDESLLRVSEVGVFGQPRGVHLIALDQPGRLLELVRERVTASVVLQRHVPVVGRRGFRVIARRAAAGDRPLQWAVEYDEGVDPDDPVVRLAADEALQEARVEVAPD